MQSPVGDSSVVALTNGAAVLHGGTSDEAARA